MSSSGPLRVAVVGGSLVGLTTALLLRDIGCEVDVYERSATLLEGRGVGIVLHPATVRYLRQRCVLDLAKLGSSASRHRYLDRQGVVVSDVARRHHFTGYNALYRRLLAAFGPDRYYLNHRVEAVAVAGDQVELQLAAQAGEQLRRCDLLVGADGISSTVRRLLLPGVSARYAGYVAWRAVLDERSLTAAAFDALADALTYFVGPDSHALAYPIPNLDGSVQPGRRLANLVWYRNAEPGPQLDALLTDRTGRRREISVPPGLVDPATESGLREAAHRELPPVLAEIVQRADEPFLQVLFDVDVPRMAFHRACLVGDAAFAVRPHAATATAKGAEDAWALAQAIADAGGDAPTALTAWEPGQLTLGRGLLERNRRLGDDVQFRNSWHPGDPELAFGLRAAGDSAELVL